MRKIVIVEESRAKRQRRRAFLGTSHRKERRAMLATSRRRNARPRTDVCRPRRRRRRHPRGSSSLFFLRRLARSRVFVE